MTIRQLAELVGLSKSAVSLALRDAPSIPLATRERVKRAAAKHNYRPNPKLAEVLGALARRQATSLNAPIALLSSWPQRQIWQTGPSFLRRCYQGLSVRAAELGYKVEEFWLREPGMSPRRMLEILRTRGIQGVLVFSYERVPARLDIDLSSFAAVVIGRALVSPRIYAVDIDHFHGFFVAWEKVVERGYRRPALVLSSGVDERTEHSWSAAFRYASTSALPPSSRLPVLLNDQLTPERFDTWRRRHRPDVLLIGDDWFFTFLEDAGLRTPRDIATVTLFRTGTPAEVAGIDGRDERLGARAVNLLVEQLRTHQTGLPTTAETLLMDGVWCDGPSLPDRTSPAA